MPPVPESPPRPEHANARAADGSDPPLARYFRILETVAAARAGLTLTEIATRLDLKAGTVHRLVRGLTALGLLRNAAGTRRYVSGPRLLNLLYLNLDPSGYAALARPVIRKGKLVRVVVVAVPESDAAVLGPQMVASDMPGRRRKPVAEMAVVGP